MPVTTNEESIVVQISQELARTLASSAAFRDTETALERYKQDPSAAALLQEFRRLQQETASTSMLWGQMDARGGTELGALQQRLESHPTLRSLQRAESELLPLLLGCILKLGELTDIDYTEACIGRSLTGCGGFSSTDEVFKALAEADGVQSAVEQLAHTLQSSASYQDFQLAKKRFQTDPDVSTIREQVRAVQGKYLEAQGKGQISVELIEEVRSKQNRLRNHPVVQRFGESRREVHLLFQKVNRSIAETLGMDIAQTLAPSSGCCG